MTQLNTWLCVIEPSHWLKKKTFICCTILVELRLPNAHPISPTQLKATFWPKLLKFHCDLSDVSFNTSVCVLLAQRMRLPIPQLRTMSPLYIKVIKNPTKTTLNRSSSISFLVFIHKEWRVIHFLTIHLSHMCTNRHENTKHKSFLHPQNDF